MLASLPAQMYSQAKKEKIGSFKVTETSIQRKTRLHKEQIKIQINLASRKLGDKHSRKRSMLTPRSFDVKKLTHAFSMERKPKYNNSGYWIKEMRKDKCNL